MNEAELLLLLVRIGDVKAEVENADAYDMVLPDKHTTDPAAAAEMISNCRRRRADATIRGVFLFFMLISQGAEL